ncbi:MAG: acetyl-CoA acetyltransferase [Candidatus Lokiarchaeum sp. GC14_75]|nr:MAG: acetyl-CoA acetyltransferase [Candidatus Lokiarchaeum sp. GC14_75]
MNSKNIPVIIGAAQFTQRKESDQTLDPLSLMVKTSQLAIEDTRVNDIKDFIDAVYMINVVSWSYEDAPGLLSEKLNIKPKEKVYFSISMGGNSPQLMVNRAAKAIEKGNHRCVLITGGEAAYTLGKKFKGIPPKSWPEKKEPKYIEEKKEGYLSAFERKNALGWPPIAYSMFESAVRAFSGRSLEDHIAYIGELYERYSKVASENPFSWARKYLKAEEITTPTQDNRYITFPYTKQMCANNFVDQSAAVIITSLEMAESLKIDPSNIVYLVGSADFKNIGEITRRPNLHDSPAVRESSRLALEQAGLTIDDIDKFDFYSCFPSMVQIIIKELGIKMDDPRNLTITGGLPFHGGPLSAYSLQAVAQAVSLIRKNPPLNVMVLANGGYNSGESVGIYSSEPGKIPWVIRDDSKVQQAILEEALPDPVEKADGNLTINAYTILYSRTGGIKRGIFIGTLKDGSRTIAITREGLPILSTLEKNEFVGRTFKVEYDPELDRNILDIV